MAIWTRLSAAQVSLRHFARCMLDGVRQHEIALRAAALTYYAIFSIFPLLWLIVGGIGRVLQHPEVQRDVLDALRVVLPGETRIVTDLVKTLDWPSGLSGLVGGAALVWAASGYFRGLLGTIAQIYDWAYRRSGILLRVQAVVVSLLLVPLSYAAVTLASLSRQFTNHLPLPAALTSLVDRFSTHVVLFLLAVVGMYVLFCFAPAPHISHKTTFFSALLTTASWALLTKLFALYLALNFSRLNILYGSIASVMALLLYLYAANLLVLLGAQTNAVLMALGCPSDE